MTYEEIKNKLRNLQSKKNCLCSLLAYIDERRMQVTGLSAVNYEKLVVENSPGNCSEDRYIKFIDWLNDLQERYEALIEDMRREEEQLNQLMQKLTPTEYEVILNRFFRGLSVAKTARIMNYSIDGVKDAQSRAIKKMSEN